VTDYFQSRPAARRGRRRAGGAGQERRDLPRRSACNPRGPAILDTARKIAENTPVQLKAANDAVTRAQARYDSGLGTLTEVADAQRLLAQAEIDDSSRG
jgi:hypothetical protein